MTMVQLNVGRVGVTNAVVVRWGSVLVIPNIMGVRGRLMRVRL